MTCKICKGTGKIFLFTSWSDCECSEDFFWMTYYDSEYRKMLFYVHKDWKDKEAEFIKSSVAIHVAYGGIWIESNECEVIRKGSRHTSRRLNGFDNLEAAKKWIEKEVKEHYSLILNSRTD